MFFRVRGFRVQRLMVLGLVYEETGFFARCKETYTSPQKGFFGFQTLHPIYTSERRKDPYCSPKPEFERDRV